MHELLKFLKKREVGYKQLVDFMQSCGSDDFPEPDPELAAGALSAERNLGNSSRLHLRGKGPVVDECGLEGPIMVYGLERQSLMGNCDRFFRRSFDRFGLATSMCNSARGPETGAGQRELET